MLCGVYDTDSLAQKVWQLKSCYELDTDNFEIVIKFEIFFIQRYI